MKSFFVGGRKDGMPPSEILQIKRELVFYVWEFSQNQTMFFDTILSFSILAPLGN
jgi:hypothetical protein